MSNSNIYPNMDLVSNRSAIEAATAVMNDCTDTIDNLSTGVSILAALAEVYADNEVTQTEVDDLFSDLSDMNISGDYTLVSPGTGAIPIHVDTVNKVITNGDNVNIVTVGGNVQGLKNTDGESFDLVDLISEYNNYISTQQGIFDITKIFTSADKPSYSDVLLLINQYSFDSMGDFRSLFSQWVANGNFSLQSWINFLKDLYGDMDSATVTGDDYINFSTEAPLTKSLFSSVLRQSVVSIASALPIVLAAIHPVLGMLGAAVSFVATSLVTIKDTIETAQTTAQINVNAAQDNYITVTGNGYIPTGYFFFNTLLERNVALESENLRYGSMSYPGANIIFWKNANSNLWQLENRLSLSYDWDAVWSDLVSWGSSIQEFPFWFGLTETDAVSASTTDNDQYISSCQPLKVFQKITSSLNAHRADPIDFIHSKINNPLYLLKAAVINGILMFMNALCWEYNITSNQTYRAFTITRTANAPGAHNSLTLSEYDTVSLLCNIATAIRNVERGVCTTNQNRTMQATLFLGLTKARNIPLYTNDIDNWTRVTNIYNKIWGPDGIVSRQNDIPNWMTPGTTGYGNYGTLICCAAGAGVKHGNGAAWDQDYNDFMPTSTNGLYSPDRWMLEPPNYDANTFKAGYAGLVACVLALAVVGSIAYALLRKVIKRRITREALKAGKLRSELNKFNMPDKRTVKSFKTPETTWAQAYQAYSMYNEYTYKPAVRQYNALYSKYNSQMWSYTIMASITGINGLPTAGSVSPLLASVTGSWLGNKLANWSAKDNTVGSEGTTDEFAILYEELQAIKSMIGVVSE